MYGSEGGWGMSRWWRARREVVGFMREESRVGRVEGWVEMRGLREEMMRRFPFEWEWLVSYFVIWF